MKLLLKEQQEDTTQKETKKRLWDWDRLEAFTKHVCTDEIDNFLVHVRAGTASNTNRDHQDKVHSAYRQVVLFTMKTLTVFCQSDMTVEQLKDPTFRRRNYFPAQKFRAAGGDGDRAGFPHDIYSDKVREYADMAYHVWMEASF